MSARKKSLDWQKCYFGDAYLEIYSEYMYDAKEIRREADFVIEMTKLNRGDRLLDLACGFGKHMKFFLKKGIRTTGVDIALPYLKFASRTFPKTHVKKSPLVCGDIAALPFADKSFHAAACLFNSFGYVDAEGNGDHGRMLKELTRVLRPGGYFFLEIPAKPAVLDMLKETPQTLQCGSDYAIFEIWDYDPDRKILYNRTNFKIKDRESQVGYQLRLFTPGELKKLYKSAGLEVTSVLGDYDGQEYDRYASPYLIMIGRRKS